MHDNKKLDGNKFTNFFSKNKITCKTLLVFTSFLIFFAVAALVIHKRSKGKVETPPLALPQKFSFKEEANQLSTRADSLHAELTTLSSRLSALETNLALQGNAPQSRDSYDKVISFELLKSVLEGSIPLETLKIFLQKNPTPWKTTLLSNLAPLGEIKTYSQLEALLVSSPPVQSHSLWQRIKSLVRIRRIGGKEEDAMGQLRDAALQQHNLQNALKTFEGLSPENQASLSSWKKLAQDRLALETIAKTLLSQIAEE